MGPIFSNSYNIADALIVYNPLYDINKEDTAVVCGQMKLKSSFE